MSRLFSFRRGSFHTPHLPITGRFERSAFASGRRPVVQRAFAQLALVQLGLVLLAAAVAGGCASIGHLNTPSGRPEITLPRALFKRAPVAITSYNIRKGRDLDLARPDTLVTYEGVKSSDGELQVRSKFVYALVPDGADSITIQSSKVMTDDLDDPGAGSEADDQATLEEEQAELEQIRAMLENVPFATQGMPTEGSNSTTVDAKPKERSASTPSR